MTLRRTPFRLASIAIVGAGPAGFYAADYLLRKNPSTTVKIFDRLPTPYGLVRYGVAPDHPEVKNAILKFDACMKTYADRIQFVGGVEVLPSTMHPPRASDNAELAPLPPSPFTLSRVALDDLIATHHYVILANGAADDVWPELDPLSKTSGLVVHAREIVEWYNGRPGAVAPGVLTKFLNQQAQPLNPRTALRHVVIAGVGNVALDVARIMALCSIDGCRDQLIASSDISASAAATLSRSGISGVTVLGRRGPRAAAYTIKELRELANLSKRWPAAVGRFDFGVCSHSLLADGLITSPDAKAIDPAALSGLDRPRRRLMELTASLAAHCGPDPELHRVEPLLGAADPLAEPAAATAAARLSPEPMPKLRSDGGGCKVRLAFQRSVGRLRHVIGPQYDTSALKYDPSTGPPGAHDYGAGYPHLLLSLESPWGRHFIRAGLLVMATGYRVRPLIASDAVVNVTPKGDTEGVTASAPQSVGRVDGVPEGVKAPSRVFGAGWAGTGPRGTIATTMDHAQGVAAAVLRCIEREGDNTANVDVEQLSCAFLPQDSELAHVLAPSFPTPPLYTSWVQWKTMETMEATRTPSTSAAELPKAADDDSDDADSSCTKPAHGCRWDKLTSVGEIAEAIVGSDAK